MISRPPTVREKLGEWLWYTSPDWEDFDCMQEALTAEWLIKQGFMPDPSDYDLGNDYDVGLRYIYQWRLEDKTR